MALSDVTLPTTSFCGQFNGPTRSQATSLERDWDFRANLDKLFSSATRLLDKGFGPHPPRGVFLACELLSNSINNRGRASLGIPYATSTLLIAASSSEVARYSFLLASANKSQSLTISGFEEGGGSTMSAMSFS